MKEPISTIDKIGRILSMGLICGGFGINIAHELGHRNTKYEQFFSKCYYFHLFTCTFLLSIIEVTTKESQL